jgi:hypothetical protein
MNNATVVTISKHNRLERQPADALHVVAVAGDADHQRGEDQRGDQRRHPQEDRRQGFDAVPIPETPANERAEDHGDQDPSVSEMQEKAEHGETRNGRCFSQRLASRI